MLLIQDEEQLQKLVPVAYTYKFEDFQIYERRAAEEILIPEISEEYWEYFLARYEQNALNAHEEKLYTWFSEVLAIYAIYLSIPEKNVAIEDGGITRLDNDTHKAAYRYQIQELRESLVNQAFKALEKALRYLEKHWREPEFNLWARSEQCTRIKKSFVVSPKDFEDYVELRFPRYEFNRMKAHIRRLELERVKPIVRPSLWKRLVQFREQSAEGAVFQERHLPVVEYLKGAVCNFAYAELMRKKGYHNKLDSLGLSFAHEESKDEPLSPEWIERVARPYEWEGKRYLQKLQKYLTKNKDNLPLFRQDYEKECNSGMFDQKPDDNLLLL